MFRCPVGVWVIEQRAIMLNATVRSPTVKETRWKNMILIILGKYPDSTGHGFVKRHNKPS